MLQKEAALAPFLALSDAKGGKPFDLTKWRFQVGHPFVPDGGRERHSRAPMLSGLSTRVVARYACAEIFILEFFKEALFAQRENRPCDLLAIRTALGHADAVALLFK